MNAVNNRAFKIAFLFILTLFLLSEVTMAGTKVERTKVFSTSDPDGKYTKQKIIKVDGKRYKAVKRKYRTISSAPNRIEKTYRRMTSKSVAGEITVNDQTYVLESVKWKEKKYKKEVIVQVSDPEKSKDIKVKGKTIRATLEDVTLLSSGGEEAFQYPAVFYGDKDVDYYVWHGTKIPASKAPYFDGYEEKVLSYLGLDPDAYTVKGIAWRSGYYKAAGGKVARNAVITGVRNAPPQYQATYRAALYTAQATYYNGQPGDTTYTRSVTITYTPAGLTLIAKICIGAGIAIAALTAATLLFVFGKRRKQES